MTIGLAEAKAKLSELVERVQSGETIIIARNGRSVAELRALHPVSVEETVARIRALRAKIARRNKAKSAWPAERLRTVAHKGHRR